LSAPSPTKSKKGKKSGKNKRGSASSSSRGAANSRVAASAFPVASSFSPLEQLPFERDSACSSVVSESTPEPPPRTEFQEWFDPLFEPQAPLADVGSLDVRRFSFDLTIVLGRPKWDELLQQQLTDGLCDDISFFGLSSYWIFHALFNAAARVAALAWDLRLSCSPDLWDNFAALYGSDAPFAYFRLYVIELRSRAIQALTALVMTNDVPANVFLERLLDRSMYSSARYSERFFIKPYFALIVPLLEDPEFQVLNVLDKLLVLIIMFQGKLDEAGRPAFMFSLPAVDQGANLFTKLRVFFNSGFYPALFPGANHPFQYKTMMFFQ
jgi:hypothetical protein